MCKNCKCSGEVEVKKRGFKKVSIHQWHKDSCTIEPELKLETTLSIYNELKLPKRATAKSAGYDVFAPFSFNLEPYEEIKIPLGFKAYMKEDEYIKFHPRSGHGFKYYIRLANTTGIGDSDYYNNTDNEGHYWIKLRNEGNKMFSVNKGEAICQAIFSKYLLADDDDFTGEIRNGGFGSTDLK